MVSGVRPRDTARRASTVRRCGIWLPELEHDRVDAGISELHACPPGTIRQRHRCTAKPDRPPIGTDIVACRPVHIQPPRPVDTLLNDRELTDAFSSFVFCAADYVGVIGGMTVLRDFGVTIDVVAGSVTDSAMGEDFVRDHLGLAAGNARRDGAKLFSLVESSLKVKAVKP